MLTNNEKAAISYYKTAKKYHVLARDESGEFAYNYEVKSFIFILKSILSILGENPNNWPNFNEIYEKRKEDIDAINGRYISDIPKLFERFPTIKESKIDGNPELKSSFNKLYSYMGSLMASFDVHYALSICKGFLDWYFKKKGRK